MKVIDIKGPGLAEDFVIPAGTDGVQFHRPLNRRDYEILSDRLLHRPEVKLRVFHSGVGQRLTDLDFLAFFPTIRRLSIELFWLTNIDGFSAVRDLDEFDFGRTKKKSYSLRFLSRFRSIKKLHIEGHRKDIDVLTSLPDLSVLSLRSVTLSDAILMTQFPKLRRLAIKLGGTTNLSDLSRLSDLTKLELWLIRGLTDLSFLEDMVSLEGLHLEALRNVTSLPSFRKLTKLRGVLLEKLPGVIDLQPVADAPALERLILYSMNNVELETLQSFVSHPTLRRLIPDLGSLKRTTYAVDLFRLDDNGNLAPR